MQRAKGGGAKCYLGRVKKDAESKGRGEMQRAKGGGAATECYFRFRVRKNILFILAFFLSAGLVEPVRFGYVQSVSDFENETEPN